MDEAATAGDKEIRLMTDSLREMIEDAETDVVIPIVARIPVDVRQTTVVRFTAIQPILTVPFML